MALPTLNQINWAEFRGWLTFAFVVVGGIITLRQYFAGQRQRRLENSFKLISLFKESLYEGDLEEWRNIFRSSSEPAGASEGHFIYFFEGERLEASYSDLFIEGSIDNGAIERMAEFFDLIGHAVQEETIDLKMVYFQLGQLMDTVHAWLTTIDTACGDKTFIEENFPYFHSLYKKGKIAYGKWPTRTYAHIE